jgi:hypothetical protein
MASLKHVALRNNKWVPMLSPGNAATDLRDKLRAIFVCRASSTISWSTPTMVIHHVRGHADVVATRSRPG